MEGETDAVNSINAEEWTRAVTLGRGRSSVGRASWARDTGRQSARVAGPVGSDSARRVLDAGGCGCRAWGSVRRLLGTDGSARPARLRHGARARSA
jgi:hypothetical protein